MQHENGHKSKYLHIHSAEKGLLAAQRLTFTECQSTCQDGHGFILQIQHSPSLSNAWLQAAYF
jgi:hypothetical protein